MHDEVAGLNDLADDGFTQIRYRLIATPSSGGQYESPWYQFDITNFKTANGGSPTSTMRAAATVPNNELSSGTFDYHFEVECLDNGMWELWDSSTPAEFTFHNRTNSVYGRGWHLDEHEFLIENQTTGSVSWLSVGNQAYFKRAGSTYANPAGLFGDLQRFGGANESAYFEYSTIEGDVWHFDRVKHTTLPNSLSDRYQLTKRTYATGNEVQYLYNDQNGDQWKDEITSRVDSNGRSVTFAYANNRLQSMTDFAGRVTAFNYGGADLQSVTYPQTRDENGNPYNATLSFGYDQPGLLSSVTDTLNRATEFNYGPIADRITETVLADGTRHEHNAMYAQALGSESGTTMAIDTRFLRTRNVNARGHSVDKLVNNFNQIEGSYVEPVYNATTGAIVTAASFLELPRDDEARIENVRKLVSTEAMPSGEPAASTYIYDANSYITEERLSDYDSNPNSRYQYSDYNESGLPRLVIDPLLRETRLTYDQTNNGANVTQRRVVMGTLDATPLAQGDVPDIVWNYTYTDGLNFPTLPKGLLLTETDPLGRVTKYEYFISPSDPTRHGRLQYVIHPDATPTIPTDNPTVEFAYSFSSTETIVTHYDELDRVTVRHYDALDRLVKVEQPDPVTGQQNGNSPVTEYKYDKEGNLRFVIDAEQNTTEYQYDSRNRLIKMIQSDPDGNGAQHAPETEYRYDAAGNRIAAIDPLGRLTTFQFDAADRLIAKVGPDVNGAVAYPWRNPVNRFDVNGDGVVSTLDLTAWDAAFGKITLGASAALPVLNKSQPPEVTMLVGFYYVDVDGTDSTLTQADREAIASYIDNPAPFAGSDQPDYLDKLGRPVTRYSYDPSGNLRFMTDAEGRVSENRYDIRSRRIKTVGEDVGGSPITQYAFDPADQLVGMTDPLNRQTQYDYDDAGRLWKTTFPDPVTGVPSTNSPYEQITYDLASNVLNQKDALLHVKSWQYDERNRVKTSVDELANETIFTYDFVGNLKTLEDPNANVTTWYYDALNRVIQEKNQLNHSRFFEYDKVGNQTKKTDRRGLITRFEHDKLYRVTFERWYSAADQFQQELSFTYDAAGNLLTASDPGFGYDYDHDDLDRVTDVGIDIPNLPPSVDLTFGYDLVGNRTQLASAVGMTNDFVNQWQYDALHRMTLVTQSGNLGNSVANKRVEWSYDVAGQMFSATRRAGLLNSSPIVSVTAYQFDKTGRIKDIEHRNGSQTSNPLAKYIYTWDKANRLDTFDSLADGIASYGYDFSGQLETADYTRYGAYQPNEDYDYDANGNRIGATPAPIDLNSYTAYWAANTGSGSTVEDVSSNDWNLSLQDNATWSTDYPAQVVNNSHSLYFDGNLDYAVADSAGTAALKIGTNDYTIAAWIKPTSAPQKMTIASHGVPLELNGKGFELAYNGNLAGAPVSIAVNSGYGFAQQISYSTHGRLEDGEWHHVGATLDRDGQMRLFVDGVPVRSITSIKTGNISPPASYGFRVGSSVQCPAGECGPGTNWFNGKIDDIKVYHAALSPAEMYNLSLNQAGDLQSYSIGANNRLTNTETGSYTYDHEGNRTSQYHDVGQQRDVYSWDHRNRLTSVTRTGPREAVQFDFESDNAYDAVDALGRVMPGCFVGNVQLVDLEESTHQNGTSEFGLQFDGNGDYVSLFIQDEFAVSKTGFSIMAYFHPEATSATMGIAGYGDVTAGKAGYRLYYVGTAGAEKLVFQLNDGVGSAQTVTHNIAGSFQNVWGHVAVTIDAVGTPSPKIRMYVGGTLVQSPDLTQTNAWPAVQTEFTLGALGGGTTGLFTGVLDDVRIARMSLPEVDIDWAKDWSALTDHELAFTEYTYDHQNRLIARTGELDNGTTTPTITTDYLIHDGTGQSITSATPDPDNLDQVGQIVLRLDESGGVKNRYLWGAGVDQLLADEQVSSGDTLWALTDHLGTIRDLVEYNGNGASVVVHRSYDAFGNVTSETNAGEVDVLFGYTGRMFDSATGLQNNLNRWLDPQVGRWISEDPIGFAAGDANVYRYVGNATTVFLDPNGEKAVPGKKTPPRHWPNPGDKWKWDVSSGRYKKGGRYRHWDETPGHRPHWDEENKDGTGHRNVYTWDVDPWLITAGLIVCIATLGEDVATGGAGVLDDPVTLGAGGTMIARGFGFAM